MNYKTKELLKKIGIFLLIAVGVFALLIAFVPKVKDWAMDQWEKCKAKFSKKK